MLASASGHANARGQACTADSKCQSTQMTVMIKIKLTVSGVRRNPVISVTAESIIISQKLKRHPRLGD